MCNSHELGGNCCPPAQIFQEKICGNFVGDGTVIPVWSAPPGDYIQGTFEIFNSSASTGPVTGAIISTPVTPTFGVFPGNSQAVSATNPTAFNITAAAGTSGTFCIILYKRVLA